MGSFGASAKVITANECRCGSKFNNRINSSISKALGVFIKSVETAFSKSSQLPLVD